MTSGAVAELPDYVRRTRAEWDSWAPDFVANGERSWALQPGFEIEDLVELQPGPNATTEFPFVTLEWARTWPCDEVWKARKRD